MRADDLTEDHFGWYIKVADKDPVLRWRHFTLIGIRKWTYEGKTTVGVIARDPDGIYKGIEYHYAPDVTVVLVQPVTPKAKRAAKAAAHA